MRALTSHRVPKEHTRGARGAIYGLIGANTVVAWNAWKHGFRQTGRRMLTASVFVIGVNLLFSAAIPFISLAAHVGGVVTGFLNAMLVGVPSGLRASWALTDEAPPGAHYTCDAKGRLFYNGPARYPLQSRLLIACPVPEGLSVAPSYANGGAIDGIAGDPFARETK